MSNDVNLNYGTGTGNLWDPNNKTDPNKTDENTKTTGSGTPETDTSVDTSGTYKTTITVSETGDVNIGSYTNLPNQPKLPQTSPNTDPNLGFTGLQLLFDFPTLLDQMISLNGAPEGSAAQVAIQENAEIEITDPYIIALAEQEGVTPNQMYQAIQTQTTAFFDQKLASLDPETAQLFKYAAMVGGKDALPTEALKIQFEEFVNFVNGEILELYPIETPPPLYSSADIAAYKEELSNAYDEAFENNLPFYVQDYKLTPEQTAQLRAMHYLGVSASSDTSLEYYLQSINQDAMAELQTTYGFGSANFVIEPNTEFYMSVINGTYVGAFNKALDTIPDLTAENRALIEKYLQNPDDPSIPSEIKELAASIKSSILPQIIASFGLSSDFEPTITTLTIPDDLKVAINLGLSAVKQAKEILQATTDLVNAMPDSPEKVLYLNFLKAVGEAVHQLELAIVSMQSGQSSIAKAMSRAKLDMQLNKLQVTKQAAQQVSEKQGKMANCGPLSEILTWVTNILLLAISIGGGPLAFATALAFVIDSTLAKQNNTTPLMQKMFMEISKACGPEAGIVVNLILTAIISSGNPFVIMALMASSARTVQDIVKVCGGDTNAQEIAGAVVNAILQLVMMVGICILTGGMAAPAAVAEFVGNILNIGKNAAETAIKVASIAVNIIITALTISESGIQLSNNLILADIDIIKGKSKSYAALVEGIINQLKKLIEKLLELLQSSSEWIVDINKFQGDKYTQSSATIQQMLASS